MNHTSSRHQERSMRLRRLLDKLLGERLLRLHDKLLGVSLLRLHDKLLGDHRWLLMIPVISSSLLQRTHCVHVHCLEYAQRFSSPTCLTQATSSLLPPPASLLPSERKRKCNPTSPLSPPGRCYDLCLLYQDRLLPSERKRKLNPTRPHSSPGR